jgi:hypothetical protein
MKTIIITLGVAGLLCGCSQQKPDPRIAELESKVIQLEQQVDEIRDLSQQCSVLIGKAQVSMESALGCFTSALPTITNMQSEIELLLKLTNSPIPVVQRIARAANQGGYSNGIPAVVYNQILTDAEKDYPGNYSTQKYAITRQIEAYRKLHP